MVINNRYLNNISRVGVNKPYTSERSVQNSGGDFGSILKEKLNSTSEVKFSKHAAERMQDRNIHLSSEQKAKINEAVNKAQQKGVKDTLVLMDNLAFVVNVKNKTVITAANKNELKENIFTNIDGAVIV